MVGRSPTSLSHRIRHGTATLLANNGMPLEELSRYLGHASTQVTRRYVVQTPDTLGSRAAEALARAGVTSAWTGDRLHEPLGSTDAASATLVA